MLGRRSARLDAVPVQRRHELVYEKRQSAGGAMARGDELRRGRVAQPRLDHARHSGVGQRCRTQHARLGLGPQDPEQRRDVAVGLGSRGHDEREWQILKPRHQEGQEAQRRRVGPVRVVDGDQQRRRGGEVRAQPVQAVQHRERAVQRLARSSPGRRARQAEQARGFAGRTLEEIVACRRRGVGQGGLEQLADHAEREVPLELASAGAQHARPRRLGRSPRRRDHGRLADARPTLDDDEAAVTGACARHGSLDAAQLGIALENARATRHRGAHAADTTPAPRATHCVPRRGPRHGRESQRS